MKKIIIGALSITLLATGFDTNAQKTTPKKPNIIFILTDDLGVGDVGVFFQNQRAKANNRSEPFTLTPQLDQMAANGAILANSYCAAPVCAPSRASILTGQSQGHANVRDNQFDKALADTYTLGNVFQKIGYATIAIGKWGLQGTGKTENWPAHPLNRGFDQYYGYMRHGDGHEHYPKEGIYRGKKQVWDNRTEVSAGLDNCYTGDLFTARAKEYIIKQQQAKPNQPFLMYLAYDTPHAVLELPTGPYPQGGGLNGGLKWIGKPGEMINTANGKPDSWMDPAYANATYDDDKNPATAEVPWPDTYKRYATSTKRIDAEVGDLLQLLADLKIDDNTLVVFSSDNGPSIESYLKQPYQADFFNAFGTFDGIKRDVLEGGMRMPVIAQWKNHIKPGSVVKQPNISYDWLPTFLDAAQIVAPAISDGVSILPSLLGKEAQNNRILYSEYFEGGKTPSYEEYAQNNRGRLRKQMQFLRKDDIVGIRYNIQSADDDFELYDVNSDPQERNNLASNSKYVNLQKEFKASALQMRRADTDAKRPYDTAYIPSVDVAKPLEGWTAKTYTSTALWVPNVSTLKPVKTSITNGFGALKSKEKIIGYTGYIKVPVDGEYKITFKTDGKAMLRLHQMQLFDADRGYASGTELKTSLKLKAGYHPIQIVLKNAQNNSLSWRIENSIGAQQGITYWH
jgi:arylsulfatase A-like enzyme